MTVRPTRELMRAFVGDILGKCRIIDIWNDSTIKRFGGNSQQEPDRDWACCAMTLYSNSEVCVIHKNGIASFFNIDSQSRSCVVHLNEAKNGFCVSHHNDQFIACYSGKCCTFNKKSQISEFETVENPSCATICEDLAAYGRLNDRTLIYDINKGEQNWTSNKPPLDELGLEVSDDDRSLLFFDKNTLFVGQNDSIVVVYDTRAGSDPIIKQKVFNEFPITAICKLQGNLIAFGDTVGSLTIMDLQSPEESIQKKSLVGRNGYTGSPAGIVSIQNHPTLPYLSILSYDRVIRMYNYEKKLNATPKAAFVKTKSDCFVMLDDQPQEEPNSDDEAWAQLSENNDSIFEDFHILPQAKKPQKEDQEPDTEE